MRIHVIDFCVTSRESSWRLASLRINPRRLPLPVGLFVSWTKSCPLTFIYGPAFLGMTTTTRIHGWTSGYTRTLPGAEPSHASSKSLSRDQLQLSGYLPRGPRVGSTYRVAFVHPIGMTCKLAAGNSPRAAITSTGRANSDFSTAGFLRPSFTTPSRRVCPPISLNRGAVPRLLGASSRLSVHSCVLAHHRDLS